MNARLHVLTFGFLLLFTAGVLAQNVRGNGHIITKEISIPNYESISIMGCSADMEYRQSNGSPGLEVIIDENVLPYITIKVDGGVLKVYPKILDEPETSRENNCNINPTTFKIVTNSKNLKNISTVGSGDISVNSNLSINKLEVSLAGSGSVNFNKTIKGAKLELSVAGSGEINAPDVRVNNLECSLAGSGEITLGGEVPRAAYNVASSGEINAYNCKVGTLECSLAGSGEIKAYAIESLNASVIGSGGIYYKGNAKTNFSQLGSGSIKKMN